MRLRSSDLAGGGYFLLSSSESKYSNGSLGPAPRSLSLPPSPHRIRTAHSFGCSHWRAGGGGMVHARRRGGASQSHVHAGGLGSIPRRTRLRRGVGASHLNCCIDIDGRWTEAIPILNIDDVFPSLPTSINALPCPPIHAYVYSNTVASGSRLARGCRCVVIAGSTGDTFIPLTSLFCSSAHMDGFRWALENI